MALTLVALPFFLMIRGEPVNTAEWLAEYKGRLNQAREDGLDSLTLYLNTAAFYIDTLNRVVGQFTAWLALFMVLMQFVVVIMRYVFSFGSIQMQESIWYMHGILFMVGAGYTLLREGHVRVDIWYREASPRRKALVDLGGVIVFLLPVCVMSWYLSWNYVANAWRIKEQSIEPGGIPYIYLLKGVILVFLALLILQGIGMALRSILVLSKRQSLLPGTEGKAH